MKTVVYLIRHGQSVANIESRFCGHSDVPLSDKGRVQAALTADFLKERKIDICFCSDLSRAHETAQIICEPHNIEPVKTVGLREINGGKWEGVTKDELRRIFPTERNVWDTNIGYTVCEGGESVREAGERFYGAVEKICKQNKGKSILIVAHALVIRTFYSFTESRNLDDIQKINFPDNASVSIVEYDGKFTPVEYSIASQLGDLANPMLKKGGW